MSSRVNKTKERASTVTTYGVGNLGGAVGPGGGLRNKKAPPSTRRESHNYEDLWFE